MWIRLLALAFVSLIIGGAIYGLVPIVGGALFGVAGICTLWALATGVIPLLQRRNPYDLGELQRIQDADEIRELLWNEAPVDPQFVVCSSCMEEYSQELPGCPRCSRR